MANQLNKTRLGYFSFAIIAILILWFFFEVALLSFKPVLIISGWFLFASIVMLILHSTRRKIQFLPIIGKPSWLQSFHNWIGGISFFLFFFHTTKLNFSYSVLEIILIGLYILVVGSGVFGYIILNFVLGKNEYDLSFDQILPRQRKILSEIEQLVQESITKVGSTNIADFYNKKLENFFNEPKYVLLFNDKLMQEIENEIFGIEEKKIITTIGKYTKEKHQLDRQYTLESISEWWLFIHVPLAWSLLIFSLFHGALAHVF